MAAKITSSKESTFHGVVFNKLRGSLTFSDAFLWFNPEGSSDEIKGIKLSWDQIAKHQVSPATHPKHLMKVVGNAPVIPSDEKVNSYTFQFLTRNGLESARRDVSTRLSKIRGAKSSAAASKKRARDETIAAASNNHSELQRQTSSPPSASYVAHDQIALISARSSLLASDPALRAQHRLLVDQNATLSEEDFWETHSRLLADEYARISGCRSEGMASSIKSSLDLGLSTGKKKDDNSNAGTRGVIHLGVEEMRQIFLMYPAVHKAYEEKVPLELSEEQFWRKYLERFACFLHA